MRRVLAAAVLLSLGVVGPARPASAHAVLRGSEPLDRQVMPEAPERVLLRFSESVAVSSSSLRVLDHHGEVVVGRGARHVRGDDAQVELRLPDLGEGAYVVTWRVVSADSHPAVGAMSFRVGEATDDFHIGASLLEAPRSDRLVGAAFGVVRFVLFASLLVLVGAVAFLRLLWPAGWAQRGPPRLVAGAWAAAVGATVAALGLQGAYSSGGEPADAVSRAVLAEVVDTRYGQATIVRLAVLVAFAAAAVVLRRSARWRAKGRAVIPTPLLGAGAVVLLGSTSWVGHAAAGRFTTAALATDVVHLLAVSMWVGGLVVLVGFVLRSTDGQTVGDADAVALRFSTVAFGSVVAMVVTGSLQSWRQLDGVDELTSTTFGRLLLVKLALVTAMLVAASFSRRLVRGPRAAPAMTLSPGPGAAARSPAAHLSALRRWVGVEVAIAGVVLAVTAGLVNAVPARSADDAAGPAIPFSTELVRDGIRLAVTLEPARTGLNDLHVYVVSEDGRFAEAGRPVDALEVSAALRLDKGDTGPIKVPLVENAPGHWSAFGFPVPIAGAWALEVAALVSDIDLVRARTDITVR